MALIPEEELSVCSKNITQENIVFSRHDVRLIRLRKVSYNMYSGKSAILNDREQNGC